MFQKRQPSTMHYTSSALPPSAALTAALFSHKVNHLESSRSTDCVDSKSMCIATCWRSYLQKNNDIIPRFLAYMCLPLAFPMLETFTLKSFKNIIWIIIYYCYKVIVLWFLPKKKAHTSNLLFSLKYVILMIYYLPNRPAKGHHHQELTTCASFILILTPRISSSS